MEYRTGMWQAFQILVGGVVGAAVGHTSHHQRPSRSCWLGSTARVHGSHPMLT